MSTGLSSKIKTSKEPFGDYLYPLKRKIEE
jgi:hypothetical protein